MYIISKPIIELILAHDEKNKKNNMNTFILSLIIFKQNDLTASYIIGNKARNIPWLSQILP